MTTVSTKQLREHLGLSPAAISSLTDRGILRKLRRGVWDLDENRRRYLEHLRGVASRHRSADGLSLVEERAKLARAQRERTEKQRVIQDWIFPEGLVWGFEARRFGTPVTNALFETFAVLGTSGEDWRPQPAPVRTLGR